MDKDFDRWNEQKKNLNEVNRVLYVHAREIWWCSLGVNIGSEIDGKNNNFERPVIIVKVYNKDSVIILPITSKEKNDIFHYKIQTSEKIVWVKLTQTRTVSAKRLLRKVDFLNQENFDLLVIAWKKLL